MAKAPQDHGIILFAHHLTTGPAFLEDISSPLAAVEQALQVGGEVRSHHFHYVAVSAQSPNRFQCIHITSEAVQEWGRTQGC